MRAVLFVPELIDCLALRRRAFGGEGHLLICNDIMHVIQVRTYLLFLIESTIAQSYNLECCEQTAGKANGLRGVQLLVRYATGGMSGLQSLRVLITGGYHQRGILLNTLSDSIGNASCWSKQGTERASAACKGSSNMFLLGLWTWKKSKSPICEGEKWVYSEMEICRVSRLINFLVSVSIRHQSTVHWRLTEGCGCRLFYGGHNCHTQK